MDKDDNKYDVFRQILETTSAVPWRIDWRTKKFTYVGPQIENLLGWKASSWISVDDWISRIHPEDRDYVVNFCVSQSISGLDHEAEYRALTSTGAYLWIRDVVHVVRDLEGVDSLIGFMLRIQTENLASPTTSSGVASIGSLLQRTFGFTHAETQLADALISGMCARDYARKRNVSINTVRSQIRALLNKTGVNRQADLIRVLIKL